MKRVTRCMSPSCRLHQTARRNKGFWRSEPRSTTFTSTSARSTGYVAKRVVNPRSPARFSKRRSECTQPCETRRPSGNLLRSILLLDEGLGVGSASQRHLAGRHRSLDVLYGLLRGGSGGEDLTHPHLLEPGDVVLGDGPPAEDQDILCLVLLEEVDDPGYQGHVGA